MNIQKLLNRVYMKFLVYPKRITTIKKSVLTNLLVNRKSDKLSRTQNHYNN